MGSDRIAELQRLAGARGGVSAKAGAMYRRMLADFEALSVLLSRPDRPTWTMVSAAYGGAETNAGGKVARSTWVRVLAAKSRVPGLKSSAVPAAAPAVPDVPTPAKAASAPAGVRRFRAAGGERDWSGGKKENGDG